MVNEKLLNDIIDTFTMMNKSKSFHKFQESIKGEKNLLAFLFQYDGECSPGKIAEALDVTAARVAAILKSLESRGYVERFTDGKDRRKTLVKLTEQGIAFVEELGEKVLGSAMTVFEKLGESDSVEFIRILKKIFSNEESVKEKGSDSSENGQ